MTIGCIRTKAHGGAVRMGSAPTVDHKHLEEKQGKI